MRSIIEGHKKAEAAGRAAIARTDGLDPVSSFYRLLQINLLVLPALIGRARRNGFDEADEVRDYA